MLVMEAAHGFGCVLLVMRVLPFVSRTPFGPVACIGIMQSICLVPSFLAVFFSQKSCRSLRKTACSLFVFCLDILAFLLEIVAVLTPVVIYCPADILSMLPFDRLRTIPYFSTDMSVGSSLSRNSSANVTSDVRELANRCVEPYCDLYWQIPLSLFLISLKWWENFVGRDRSCLKLFQAKKVVHVVRVKLNLVASGVAIAATIGSWYLLEYFQDRSDPSFLNKLDLSAVESDARKPVGYEVISNIPCIVCVFCGLVCYCMSCLACKLLMQKVSFCIPMYLSMPTLVGILLLQCYGYLPTVVIDDRRVFIDYCHMPIGNHGYQFACASIWWLVFLWINRHVWFPSAERIAKTQK